MSAEFLVEPLPYGGAEAGLGSTTGLHAEGRSTSRPGTYSSGRVPREIVMKILLVSMPDSFEHMPTVGIRMPNGALSSLAGNIDRHHQVAVADLILVQRDARPTLERLVGEGTPAFIGLSVMTFHRNTALRCLLLVRALRTPGRVGVRGYYPMPAPAASPLYPSARAF